MALELDSANYRKEVLESEIPVIVDHWADWCGPCRMLASVFERLSNDSAFKGKLKFAKLNVDLNAEIAGQNGIRGIPCLIVFRKGKEAGRIVGSMPEESLKLKIKEILAKI
jgi:thioredoxin 1